MTKREFLKSIGVAAATVGTGSLVTVSSAPKASAAQGDSKYWLWMRPDVRKPLEDYRRTFARIKKAGIDAILPEIFNGRNALYGSKHLPVRDAWLEKILPVAKSEGIEVHAWMWCMPCNIEDIRTKHPEWYNVNRNGESSSVKPAYVDYYKFLCPTREPVHEFIQTRVKELAQIDDLDGIHLDYIRYPDVILAEALQPKYKIVQNREFPEYDYCYCEVCRNTFKKEAGYDPLDQDDPTVDVTWRRFRYDRITNLVNNTLVPVIHNAGKMATAAVFPNWEYVRQEWFAWDIDAALPMLYHGFYNEDIRWIRKHVEKETAWLKASTPLYAGLFIPDLKPEELPLAVEASLKGGAKGVSLFDLGSMNDAFWEQFSKAVSM